MAEADTARRSPIDLEELAAFIDGRLEGDRRREMIERLADDEEAYELYDEVIRSREELDGEAVAAPATISPVVKPFRRRRSPAGSGSRHLGWWAAAAAAACAVFLGWLVLRSSPLVPPSVHMVARLGPAVSGPRSAEVLAGADLPVFRSAESSLFSEPAARFRLGVRSFDLAVAAAADDTERSGTCLSEIGILLDSEMPLGSASRAEYLAIAENLAGGVSALSLRSRIAAAERILEGELDSEGWPPYFAFGRWTAAVRSATVLGDRAFLARPAARRPVATLIELNPAPAVREALAVLDRELQRGDEADLESIESATSRILRACTLADACLEP